MECVADNEWRISLGESGRPFAFKFLVNDLSWSAGADFVVEAGASITLEPSF
jgi:formyltetrahydrofolate synthetase